MNDISTAKKDGSQIIIAWKTPGHDTKSFDVREASFNEASMCWEYISDNNFFLRIPDENIIGWIPIPNYK